jgi:proton-translocating NAD(P)+ transhydrogenase subunit beta
MNRALELVYIVCAVLFILGIKMLGSPRTARRGNALSALGMLLAVVTTLLDQGIVDYRWIVGGLALGSVIGAVTARRVAMTAMPEMVALLNGFGGLASLLVAWEAYEAKPGVELYTALTLIASVLIGGVTFTGSVMAWGKLSERLPGRPILFRGQNVLNGLVLILVVAGAVRFTMAPAAQHGLFLILIGLAGLLGVLAVLPIGGADMPVVISLLNSYSGLAACATGFLLRNNALIVTGSLVGASGLILTRLMCKAMNRSLANVLFSGFGAVTRSAAVVKGQAKPISVADAYVLLEAARLVVIVPGYGLAVAQAQHLARELSELLQENGTEVRFAIHPVAGRMPGHMNVLLAEANVPYEQLSEMETVNPIMETADVCLVVGANDVVNPSAHEDAASPIFGMPIIEAEKARTVLVLKRSLAPGFAGVENPLFFRDNTRMLFGDAKVTLQELVGEFKGA